MLAWILIKTCIFGKYTEMYKYAICIPEFKIKCLNPLMSTISSNFSSQLTGFGQQMPATHTQIISRANWGARPSTLVEHFNGPAPYVIIHHSYMPSACYTTADCIKAMHSMQDYHQLQRGWNDIGYSFAIGGDGMIYVGRGFNVIGAHAPKYNDRSVGICMIGDWRSKYAKRPYAVIYVLAKLNEKCLWFCL